MHSFLHMVLYYLIFSFNWQSRNLVVFDLWPSGLVGKVCQCRRWFFSAEIDGREKGESYSGKLSLAFCPKSTWCSVALRKMMIFHYPYFCRKLPTMIVILQDSCPSKLFHPISLTSFPEFLRCQRTQQFLRLEIYQTVRPGMIDATNEWTPGCGLLIRLLCIKKETYKQYVNITIGRF